MASFLAYAGALATVAGAIRVLWHGGRTRRRPHGRAFVPVLIGFGLLVLGFSLPVRDSRVDVPRSKLDELAPVWLRAIATRAERGAAASGPAARTGPASIKHRSLV